jgi:alkanesulfonate monooxygenase SsuD/methylene tetrahydromethanopterin reductase-like flavin-dependent oxidoreductase (luciferase family)
VVASVAKGHIFGSPETVKAGLADLIERTGADELIISTMVYDQKDRLKSYELVSEIEF